MKAGIMGADGRAFFEAQNAFATVRTQQHKDSLKRAKIGYLSTLHISAESRLPHPHLGLGSPNYRFIRRSKETASAKKKLVEGGSKVAVAIIHSSYSDIGGIRTNSQKLVDLARRGFVEATTGCAKMST